MIKVNATLIGRITSSAVIKTDRNERPFLRFEVAVVLQDAKTKQNEVTFVVTDYQGSQSDLSKYVEKKRVEVKGDLRIRKNGEDFSFYLGASEINMKDVPSIDNVGGELSFIGHTNKKGAEIWHDKKNRPFVSVSCRSTEKINDDTYVDTWVDFLRFPAKDQKEEDLVPDWLVPKCKLNITGDFQLRSYDSKLRFSSRVKEWSLYVPKKND